MGEQFDAARGCWPWSMDGACGCGRSVDPFVLGRTNQSNFRLRDFSTESYLRGYAEFIRLLGSTSSRPLYIRGYMTSVPHQKLQPNPKTAQRPTNSKIDNQNVLYKDYHSKGGNTGTGTNWRPRYIVSRWTANDQERMVKMVLHVKQRKFKRGSRRRTLRARMMASSSRRTKPQPQ